MMRILDKTLFLMFFFICLTNCSTISEKLHRQAQLNKRDPVNFKRSRISANKNTNDPPLNMPISKLLRNLQNDNTSLKLQTNATLKSSDSKTAPLNLQNDETMKDPQINIAPLQQQNNNQLKSPQVNDAAIVSPSKTPLSPQKAMNIQDNKSVAKTPLNGEKEKSTENEENNEKVASGDSDKRRKLMSDMEGVISSAKKMQEQLKEHDDINQIFHRKLYQLSSSSEKPPDNKSGNSKEPNSKRVLSTMLVIGESIIRKVVNVLIETKFSGYMFIKNTVCGSLCIVCGNRGGFGSCIGDNCGVIGGGSWPCVGDHCGGIGGGSWPCVGDHCGGIGGGSWPCVGDGCGGIGGGSWPCVGDGCGGIGGGSWPCVGDGCGGIGGGSWPCVGDGCGCVGIHCISYDDAGCPDGNCKSSVNKE